MMMAMTINNEDLASMPNLLSKVHISDAVSAFDIYKRIHIVELCLTFYCRSDQMGKHFWICFICKHGRAMCGVAFQSEHIVPYPIIVSWSS